MWEWPGPAKNVSVSLGTADDAAMEKAIKESLLVLEKERARALNVNRNAQEEEENMARAIRASLEENWRA